MNVFEKNSISRRNFLKASGLVGAAGLLAACGGGSSSSTATSSAASGAASAPEAPNSTGANPLTEYIASETNTRELEAWNWLYSQDASDSNVVCNLVQGMLSCDKYGKLAPAIATSWEHNDDATQWTFHLREDVDWCDVNGEVKAHCTSKDFLVGLEWCLNALKNEANNTSMPTSTLVGAQEYYDYTKDQGDAAADLTYEDMLAKGVGVEAPDDYTLVFTCFAPCPYFDSVASYSSFSPAPQDLIDELGVDGFRACEYSNMWYNGPYLIEEFVMSNTKSFIPNPNWYGASEHSRFERVTVTMIADATVEYQLYQNRELDEMDLGESTLTTITADPSNVYNDYLVEKRPKKYSYQMHWNYQKNKEDGTPDDNWNKAIANTAFRQCLYRGLDLTARMARTNKINPLKCENDFYTMTGVCYTSSGADYTSLVKSKMYFADEEYDGETMIRLRNQDIESLKKQAMDELTAIGVTFPVSFNYYILAGDSSQKDGADVFAQCFSQSLGDDFVKLEIGTYVSSITKEVVNAHLASFVTNGWSADFDDPSNFLGQEILHDDNAYYAVYYSNIAAVSEAPADYQKDLIDCYEEFTRLEQEAVAITNDTDARYEAFATAEAYMLDKGLVCPYEYEITWALTHANEYSKINGMFGGFNYTYIDWETTDAEYGYTTAEYEEFAKAFAAATA